MNVDDLDFIDLDEVPDSLEASSDWPGGFREAADYRRSQQRVLVAGWNLKSKSKIRLRKHTRARAVNTKREIAGVVCSEFLPESSCGFISYVGVTRPHRQKGIARKLIEHALRELQDDAGHRPRAVFAAAHLPTEIQPGHSVVSMDAERRTSFFMRLDGRRVPIEGFQFASEGGTMRWDVVALPFGECSTGRVDTRMIAAFLDEYRGVVGTDETEDQFGCHPKHEFQDREVLLAPLRIRPEVEKPVAFSNFAIAFHFVSTHPETTALEPASEPFTSYERDVLAYSYRGETAPFSTRAVDVSAEVGTIELEFASEIHFMSEGYAEILRGSTARRTMKVQACETRFKTGIDVKHLIIQPNDQKPCPITDYDLIKLIKLWEGGEKVYGRFEGEAPKTPLTAAGEGNAESCVRFLVGKEVLTIRGLAHRIFGSDFDIEGAGPRAGTVALSGSNASSDLWPEMRDVVASARDSKHWEEIRRPIVGIAGIVQGLIDFEAIGPAELRDVLKGLKLTGLDDEDEQGLFGLHKGTLIKIEQEDRPGDDARPPYPLIYEILPHALLLNNEAQLEIADDAWHRVERHPHFGTVNDAVLDMHAALDSNYLPNVFHYPVQRAIVEDGFASLALTERAVQLRGRLADVKTKYDLKVDTRRGIAEDVRNVLLLVLAYGSAREVLSGASKGSILVGLTVVAVLYLLARQWPRLTRAWRKWSNARRRSRSEGSRVG